MLIDLPTSKVFQPLQRPARYKGLKGGRASGKSHFLAEESVISMVEDSSLPFVCIREIQKSLKFSAKRLVENKIEKMGVRHLFDITQNEIRRKGYSGIMIFQGMQDHTADSIKSLEGFKRGWVEEAQSLSSRSLKLLRPTIREEGSEIWFSWNPTNAEDPIDEFFCGKSGPPDDSILVHVNYTDNIHLTNTIRLEALRDKRRMSPEDYAHVWLGAYDIKSESRVFSGYWTEEAFEPDPDKWDGPYFGQDFGFSTDPSVMVKLWIYQDKLYVERAAGRAGIDLDDFAEYFHPLIPGCEENVIQADSARPETISYLKRHGFPGMRGVEKWEGSVKDGIDFIKQFDQVVIHPRCKGVIKEFRLYSYKTNKAGIILPVLLDENNHYIDAIRYALVRLIRGKKRAGTW